MADDKKDKGDDPGGPSSPYWEGIPGEVRMFVYEHLRKEIAAARCRQAEARLASQAMAHGAAKEPSPAEVSAIVIQAAFESALLELESADPDICEECGNLHERTAPHPKDLS